MGEESRNGALKICLFLDHSRAEMGKSIYIIEPPADLGKTEQVDADGFMTELGLSPSPTLKLGGFQSSVLLPKPGMARVGSRIYFAGGVNKSAVEQEKKKRAVHFLDINNPVAGLRPVAPMHAPKERPCLFTHQDYVYALGSFLTKADQLSTTTTGTGSGYFERYNPSSDEWEVLLDPPVSFIDFTTLDWSDCATVVADLVYIGYRAGCVVYNLVTKQWLPNLPLPPPHFPCGSLYVDGSFYYLTGQGVWRPGSMLDADHTGYGNPLQLVKTTTRDGADADADGKEQVVMATDIVLDEGNFYTSYNFRPWRKLIHLGGPFFCYLVTAQLVDFEECTYNDPNSRAVWINVFEEVQPDINKFEFRSRATFSYRVTTRRTHSIRCCAFGTVPPSWNKAIRKKKEESKCISQSLKMDTRVLQNQSWVVKTDQLEAGKSHQEREDAVNRGKKDDDDLVKILAAQEAEISRLRAMLREKDQRMKMLLATPRSTPVRSES